LWSPDGSRILFTRNRPEFGLYIKDIGSNRIEELLPESPGSKFPSDWSPDGRFIAFDWVNPKSGYDIWIVPLEGDRKPVPFLDSPFEDSRAHFSPDGRWLAYQTDETTRRYIRPSILRAGRCAGKWYISTGGNTARWRRDGKELFYHQVGTRMMMSVEIRTAPDGALQPGTPKPMFETDLRGDAGEYYDVSPDGQQFLLIVPATGLSAIPLTVVLNWTRELHQ
jgi:dipeptidyl aminopeptidase/acylaminoacyl peptidase